MILLGNFITRPIHFFGTVGIAFNMIAFGCALDVFYEKFIQGDQASENPFLFLAVFFALVGIQIIMVGFLAEILIRVYHESQHKKTYIIQEIVNSKNKTDK